MAILKFFFFILLFLGCKTLNLPKSEIPIVDNPDNLTLTEIHCFNMAEKTIGIGTKNDEILLLIFNENLKKEIVLLKSTDFLIFEKEDAIGQPLNISIPLKTEVDTPSKLIFLLLELDTERTKAELIHLSEKLLSQNLPTDILKEKLREDDLLGVKTLSATKGLKSGRLIFSGMHLFDKFHYEIAYSLEKL